MPRRENSGHRALVTGARRLGREVVLALASDGHDVAFTHRANGTHVQELADETSARGVRALPVRADLATRVGCQRAVNHMVAAWGGCDVVVHLASRYERRALAAHDAVTLGADLAVDLDALLWTALAALPHMRERRHGHIIVVSDWTAAARRPRYSGYLGYYVAKSCAIALTEALALEVARDGVRVNAVAAGPILPPEGMTPASVAAAASATPLSRWGGGSAIADAVLALLQQEFVTGQTVRVDGGRALA